MSGTLFIRNRQRVYPVDTRYWRRLLRWLLRQRLPNTSYNLGIYVVRTPEMTGLNEAFLRHQGPTDVITFDYSTEEVLFPVIPPDAPRSRRYSGSRIVNVRARIQGEIFICIDEAVTQARRFRTSWPRELIRYSVHGILHLLGYDDARSADRRKMKREEDRLLRQLGRAFPLTKVARRPGASHRSARGGTGAARLSLEQMRSAR